MSLLEINITTEEITATRELTTHDCVEESVNTTQDPSKSFNLVRITWVTLTSLLIFTIGMLGNVTTIYIYARSKKLRRNKVFELVLAAFDVYALLVLLPIYAVDVARNEGLSKYFSLAIASCAHSYHITILCSTICRYVAVYHPFKFNTFFQKWGPRFTTVISIVTMVMFTRTLTVVVIFNVRSIHTFVDIILLTVASFTCTAILFVAIIIRLKETQRCECGAAYRRQQVSGW